MMVFTLFILPASIMALGWTAAFLHMRHAARDDAVPRRAVSVGAAD